MSQNAVVRSISTEAGAARAAWFTMFRERFYLYGKAYLLDWTVRPIFEVATVALIYANAPNDLVPYVVVAVAANMFLFSTVYYVGEILDRERVKGTLAPLFLTPVSRFSWMTGYALAGLYETLVRATIILVAGMLLFNVRLDPNLLTLAVVVPVYLLSLSGIGLFLGGIGLYIKRSNALSNLISPFLLLLGGVYFPVFELPAVLEFIARLFPMGYGMEAITVAAIDHASIGEVQSSLYPLLLFAVISPALGIISFNYLDRMIRKRGEVDLY